VFAGATSSTESRAEGGAVRLRPARSVLSSGGAGPLSAAAASRRFFSRDRACTRALLRLHSSHFRLVATETKRLHCLREHLSPIIARGGLEGEERRVNGRVRIKKAVQQKEPVNAPLVGVTVGLYLFTSHKPAAQTSRACMTQGE
jgi:hypothetical protein